MAKEYLDKAGLTYFWGKIKALFLGKEETAYKTASVPYGEIDSSSTSTVFTATVTGITELRDGATVILHNGVVTSAANCTLNINGLGAKRIYNTFNGTALGTGFTLNSTFMFVYDEDLIDGGCWCWYGGHYISNTNTVGEYAGAITAGTNGLARYSLAMQVDEDHWESLVKTSGTGTAKAKNANGFLLTSSILYQSGGTYASGANAGQSGCWTTASFDTRYSTNGGQFSVAGKPFYLIGTISNGKFYLKDTTWWADELPATNDGYYYIYIGQFYSKYQCTLYPHHPIFYYDDGLKQYNPADTVNGHTVESDVPANAKFTDTTYTAATAAPGKVASASSQGTSANYARQDHTHGIDLATGDANGQVKIAGTNVSVKGLAALAYKASLAKSDVGLGNVDNTADANKSVSSAATLTTARNIDGVDFNGSADIIHFGDCSTAAGTAAKTVNCSGFKLVSGAWIAVQFRSTNTAANPTLNVNGTGAKEIWYRTERLATANLLHIQQMGIYLFVYYLDHYYLVGHMYDIATESEAGLMSATDKQKLTSKAAVSGGTDLSLVTTGEKYNWNNNSASGDITVDSVTITGHASAIGHTNSGDGTKSLANSTSMTKLADMTTLGAGTWLITVGARFTGNATGTRALQIYLDGAADGPGYESGNVAGSGQFSLNCTTVVESDSSVDVDIYARQNSGAALSVSYYWKVVRIA